MKPSPEKFQHSNSISRIATGWNPTIAWKASPTRTPPPICTSAPFPKPRWSQDRGRREQFRNTRCTAARNAFDSTAARSIPVRPTGRHRESCETRKQVFESPQKIARSRCAVTICDVLQKNIYKSFKLEPTERFFQTLLPAMGISDYRNNDFRVSFERVTRHAARAKSAAHYLLRSAVVSQTAFCFGCGKNASSKNKEPSGRSERVDASATQKNKQPGRSRAV